MKRHPYDLAVGGALVLLLAAALFGAGGTVEVIYRFLLWAWAAAALALWRSPSRADKTLAAIMVPAILLAFLLPGRLKREIRRLGKLDS